MSDQTGAGKDGAVVRVDDVDLAERVLLFMIYRKTDEWIQVEHMKSLIAQVFGFDVAGELERRWKGTTPCQTK